MFTVDKPGAPTGKCKVVITTDTAGSTNPEIAKLSERVPAKYNTESKLTELVEPGDNVFHFELQSK